MFDQLTQKMSQALRNLRGLGKISEQNITESLKDVRMALLSADVHFKIVNQFIENVKQQSLGIQVTPGVNPGEMIVKIIHDELVKLLGDEALDLPPTKPLKIMMVGLHGAGKTTTSGKLVQRLKKKGYTVALVACDVYRPAAIDQLAYLAKQTQALFYANKETQDVLKIAQDSLKQAIADGANAIIFDTAGRLQIDEPLIQELKNLKKHIEPEETLLVADSALGQEAVNVAKHFHEAINLTGLILTKLDGDARGGAAVSIKAITGVPIRFLGTGEKLDQLELFHADRMAQRILGMGDVVSLVEKAQEVISEKEAEKMAEKLKRAEFTLNDFLTQMQQMKKLGPISQLMKMLPGGHQFEVGEKEMKDMKRSEAILQSMTFKERENPNILNASRKTRIAKGSGTTAKDINELLTKFTQMQKMMKMFKGEKGMNKMKQLAQQFKHKGGKSPFGPF